MSAELEALFPNLKAQGYRDTSNRGGGYNCIAWAAGKDDAWWEPIPGYYWPSDVPQMATLKTAVEAFKELGFKPCEGDGMEEGFEKIAIYAFTDVDEYTHAARQLPNGKWTSKMGLLEDIEHDTLDGLVGVEYGAVAQIMKRAKPD